MFYNVVQLRTALVATPIGILPPLQRVPGPSPDEPLFQHHAEPRFRNAFAGASFDLVLQARQGPVWPIRDVGRQDLFDHRQGRLRFGCCGPAALRARNPATPCGQRSTANAARCPCARRTPRRSARWSIPPTTVGWPAPDRLPPDRTSAPRPAIPRVARQSPKSTTGSAHFLHMPQFPL